MDRLEALLKRYARRKPARWWIGSRPDAREGALPRAIAARIGYPETGNAPPRDEPLVRIDGPRAAHILALAGTTSLAYGNGGPRASFVAEAREVLHASLAPDARYFTNGDWDMGRPARGWRPLSAATFDCGVIGYDGANAFIFWVEEED